MQSKDLRIGNYVNFDFRGKLSLIKVSLKDLEAMLVKPQGKPMIALSTDKRQAITNVKDCFEDLSSN